MLNSVMLDIVIIALPAVFMYVGWKRGMFRSLAELAVTVVALALAYQAAGLAASAIVEHSLRPAAHAAIETRVDELLADGTGSVSPREGLERVLEAIPNDYLREKADEVLDGLDLSAAEQAGWSARTKMVELGCAAADEALDTVVYGAIHALVWLVAFLLLTLILRLVVRAMGLTMKLPVLRQLNELGGLLLGAGKGMLLAWLAVRVLDGAELLAPGAKDGSLLLSLVGRITAGV